mmetsp:Transcript_9227/g.13024  ORF Transcript_9227/g.13024 Transcript_9227/m.13024 type:complete len:140 (-) Transcript_9227:159-578(-)
MQEEQNQQRQQLDQFRELQGNMVHQTIMNSPFTQRGLPQADDMDGPGAPVAESDQHSEGLHGEDPGQRARTIEEGRDLVWGSRPSGTMAPVAGGAHRAHDVRPGSLEWRLYYGYPENPQPDANSNTSAQRSAVADPGPL